MYSNLDSVFSPTPPLAPGPQGSLPSHPPNNPGSCDCRTLNPVRACVLCVCASFANLKRALCTQIWTLCSSLDETFAAFFTMGGKPELGGMAADLPDSCASCSAVTEVEILKAGPDSRVVGLSTDPSGMHCIVSARVQVSPVSGCHASSPLHPLLTEACITLRTLC
jgi:hypothetical protein